MQHYIASNRVVRRRKGEWKFSSSGYDYPKLSLRFARYDMQADDYTLYDDLSSRQLNDIGRVNYEKVKDGSRKMFEEIYDQLLQASDGAGDLLVFIHGFGNDESDIKNNIQQLHKHYVKGPSKVQTVLVFYWTTNGITLSPKEYRLDAYDSEVGGQAFSRLYYKLIDFIRFFFKQEKKKMCGKDIHLFCHSMGAMVLKNMMLYLKKSENINKDPIYEVFKEIILVAPDVSAEVFESGQAFDNLLSLGHRVHIYGHKNDVALKISGKIHQVERLGGVLEPSRLNLPNNVFYVNASQGTKADWQGIKDEAISHWYHYNSENIIEDINRVLDGGDSHYY